MCRWVETVGCELAVWRVASGALSYDQPAYTGLLRLDADDTLRCTVATGRSPGDLRVHDGGGGRPDPVQSGDSAGEVATTGDRSHGGLPHPSAGD